MLNHLLLEAQVEAVNIQAIQNIDSQRFQFRFLAMLDHLTLQPVPILFQVVMKLR